MQIEGLGEQLMPPHRELTAAVPTLDVLGVAKQQLTVLVTAPAHRVAAVLRDDWQWLARQACVLRGCSRGNRIGNIAR